jgi:1-acyl-sn-glycerol-3-phosphate acyltransferase
MNLLYATIRRLMRGVVRLLFRLEVVGLERVPTDRPLLLASNHQSNWDPPLIGCSLPIEICFVAKRQLFANPLLGGVLRALNAIPIERGGADRRALKQIRGRLARGRSVLLFPEGTRSRDGGLGAARAGLGLIVEGIDVDALPICILGSQGRIGLGRRPRVRIEFGHVIDRSRLAELAAPADPAERRGERHQRLSEAVFAQVRELHQAASARHAPS